VTRGLRTLGAFLPKSIRTAPRNVVASGMMVFCRKAAETKRQKLSVIIPAYNEAATVKTLVESVLKKQILGMDIEIVLVESNSTDGTREIATKLAHHPRVNLILEDRPRGKGHAVRTGLAAATGDYILIQDADLEYDLEDYESVLEPLLGARHAFVLGSRHGGRNIWKMRQFTGQRFLFTTLVNVLFLQRLRDPFTMYKVFRRDCLYGLTFQCDRFDFDYELLINLLRKGYKPIEIPVNYRSRSFKDGKKVSIWRDPITWLQALVRLRFTKVDPLAEIERQRNAEVTLSLPATAAASVQPALLHR
jgi:glycosyltransferase involved in cell wall biosynthesis